MPAISRIWAGSALIGAGLQPQQGKLEPGRLVSAIGLLIPQCRPGRTTKTPRLQGNLSRRSRSYGHSMGVNTPARKSALVGQDCLAGMDRVRADPGSALLSAAPVAPSTSTTAGRLAGCFGRERLLGIEVGLAQIYPRWLARVPASVRAPLVTRHPTIDLDASDIEVYGRTKEGVGWNYAGVRSGRVHLASWAQAELPLAMDLMAGNDDVRPPATELLRRALAVLPTQVCGRPRVRADAGYFDAALAHGAVELGCDFAIAAKRNSAAWRAFSAIPEATWQDARGMAEK